MYHMTWQGDSTMNAYIFNGVNTNISEKTQNEVNNILCIFLSVEASLHGPRDLHLHPSFPSHCEVSFHLMLGLMHLMHVDL